MQTSLSAEDMQFIVTSGSGIQYGVLRWEKRSASERSLEFFEWVQAQGKWLPIKVRLDLMSRLRNIFWEATWMPMVCDAMAGTADGFAFEFSSDNHDGDNFNWHASYSARRRRVHLERLGAV